MDFVEVFTTNITTPEAADRVIEWLASVFEPSQVNVDLQDVDRVLRIASPVVIDAGVVITIVESLGFQAEVMTDWVLKEDLDSKIKI